jgi:hypothetical protein
MEIVLAFYILTEATLVFLFGKYIKKDKAYWGAALIGLVNAGYSKYQSDQQREKAKNLKPSNFVPASVQEGIDNAKLLSNSETPGYTRGAEKIGQSTANMINNIKKIGGNPSQIQAGVVDADVREKEALKDLAVSDSAFKANQRQNLNNLLMVKGGYEKSSFDAFAAAKSALLGAANQNQYNAFTQGLEGIAGSLPNSAYKTNSNSVEIGQNEVAIPGAQTQGQNLTPAQKAYINKLLGLDNPVYQGNFNPYTQ